jgi:hypothetical protein
MFIAPEDAGTGVGRSGATESVDCDEVLSVRKIFATEMKWGLGELVTEKKS